MTRTGAGFRYALWALLLTSVAFTSCVKKTITTRKRTYSIVGSGGEPDDSSKMKKRFASGFSIGEDGTMQTDKKDLYSGKSFRNTKGNYTEPKAFWGGKKDFGAKEYNTPEYLSRQKYYRTKDSSMTKEARESDVDRFTTIDGNKEAHIKKSKPSFLDWLNPFSKKKTYQGADKTYRTSINRTGSRAVAAAPAPEPMSQIGASPQKRADPALSMDDVKKMLNPASFGQLKR